MAQTNPIIALGCVCGVVLVGGGGIIANLPDVLVFISMVDPPVNHVALHVRATFIYVITSIQYSLYTIIIQKMQSLYPPNIHDQQIYI
jgi:hypothetical protein